MADKATENPGAPLAHNPDHAFIPEGDLAPRIQAETVNALDTLFEEAKAAGDEGDVESLAEENTPAPEPTPEEIEAKKKADEDAAKAKADADAAAAAADPEKAKADAEAAEKAKKDAEAAAAAAKEDAFEKIVLPPHASPKATESFALLKTTARETAAKLQAEVAEKTRIAEEFKAKLAEVEANTGKLPEPVEKELTELRQWKAAQEVESDPRIKAFDEKIVANDKTILGKLRDSGIFSEKTLTDIEKLGGASKVDMEPLLEKLPSLTRRLVEAKLIETEQLSDTRKQTLDQAKANATKFLEERAGHDEQRGVKALQGYIQHIPWAVEQAIPTNAAADEKVKLGEHNKVARAAQARLKNILSERTPERFVELGIGTLIAENQLVEIAALEAKIAKQADTQKAAVDAVQAQLAKVTAERDALTKKLEGIRRAEAPRAGREIPSGGNPPRRTGDVDLRDGSSALDAHAADLAQA